MNEESYPEAALPPELGDLPDGETVTKVVEMKRKGDRLCFVSVEGLPLSSAPVQSTEEPAPEEEVRLGVNGAKASDFMMSKMPAYQ